MHQLPILEVKHHSWIDGRIRQKNTIQVDWPCSAIVISRLAPFRAVSSEDIQALGEARACSNKHVEVIRFARSIRPRGRNISHSGVWYSTQAQRSLGLYPRFRMSLGRL